MKSKVTKERFSGGRRRLLALIGAGSAFTAARMAGEARSHDDSRRDDSARRHLSLHTRLTREYGVRYPFVSAGMGFVSYPPLVTAVCNAGGIGVLGNAVEPPPSTQALIRMIGQGTSGLFGVDLLHDTTAFGPATTDAHIEVCAAERVKLVVFHMNVPPRRWVDQLHAGGCRVWQQVASVEQAIEAAALGIDAVIAQGRQAGGHNRSVVRTMPLLRRVIRAVRPMMVLASGGIANGADVAEALAARRRGRVGRDADGGVDRSLRARRLQASPARRTWAGDRGDHRVRTGVSERAVPRASNGPRAEGRGPGGSDSAATTRRRAHRRNGALSVHLAGAVHHAAVQRHRSHAGYDRRSSTSWDFPRGKTAYARSRK